MTQLPAFAAEARLYGQPPRPTVPSLVPLRADTLIIDADRRICSMLLRGHQRVEVDPATLGLVVALQLGPAVPPKQAPPDRLASALEPDDAGERVRGAGAPIDLAATAALDVTELARLRSQHTIPFEPAARKRPSPAPPARAPATQVAAPDLSTTLAVDVAELARLRAQHAVPFETPCPQPPAPPPAAAPAARSAPRDLGQTAALQEDEVARLRAHHAVPFEAAGAPRSTEPSAAAGALTGPLTKAEPSWLSQGGRLSVTAVGVDAEIAQLRAARAVPFVTDAEGTGTERPVWLPATSARRMPAAAELGRTAAGVDEAIVKLRVQYAVPFAAKALASPSDRPEGDPPPTLGGLGLAFLAALEELDEPRRD
jgi:hypothetical protein